MSTLEQIVQLPTATSVSVDDYMVIVDQPEGSAITKKVRTQKIIDLFIEIDGGDISE